MRIIRFLIWGSLSLFFIGCSNTDPIRDTAYFQENPEKCRMYMAAVDKNMKVLTEQVEKGHITVEEFDAARAKILESPSYKAARAAIEILSKD